MRRRLFGNKGDTGNMCCHESNAEDGVDHRGGEESACLDEGQRLGVQRVREVHGGHARPLARAPHDLAPHLPANTPARRFIYGWGHGVF